MGNHMWPVSCMRSPASESVSAHGCISVILGYSMPPPSSTPSMEVIVGQGYGQR